MVAKPLAQVLLLMVFLVPAYPQAASNSQEQIPDAPAPNNPSPFPANTPPAPKVERPVAPAADEPLPLPPPPTVVDSAKAMPSSARPTNPGSDSRDDLAPTIKKTVNFVVVPVTVKDSDNRLVEGLLKKDFSILEDGEPQQIRLFISDPFPLSVALVLDTNLPDQTIRKVKDTLPALGGSFSDFDEVGVFTYGSTVSERIEFSGGGENFSTALVHSQVDVRGRSDLAPVASGPMVGGPTPSVNGHPFENSVPHVAHMPQESSVLNDAILAAASALSKRDRTRRKIIFVISDGHEKGSNASYSDVLKVLLSNEIAVYAIAVDASAIPIWETLNNVHIPRFGYGNILGRYVNATGGWVYAEFDKDAIEQTYARVTEEARNQYTLGYNTRAATAGSYRTIDVRVHRPGLIVRAKDGYYPLPPQRQQQP
jgi:VWFA-related protein